MKKDKENNEIVISHDKADKNNGSALETDRTIIITEQTTDQPANQTKSSAPTLFLKLAKQFALEGGMLSVEKQMPIEERSHKRERVSALRKQQNIEAIVQKTLGYCANSDIDSRADQDWFSRYIYLAEDVSNVTMQDLWAKILAGELSRPGSFSLKALKIFRDMSIHDAKLLAKACSLAIKDSSKKNIRIISGVYQQPGLFNFFDKNRQRHINVSHFGLNYSDLLALSENHLIFLQESESSVLTQGETLHFTYNGLPLNLTCKKSNTIIQFYKFTPIGTELAHLISDKADNNFFSSLKTQLNYHFNIDDS